MTLRNTLLTALLACALGCTTTSAREKNGDAPKPADQTATVDFAPLLNIKPVSWSVLPSSPPPADTMARVLLSPNLVFESSRSSLAEPATVGESVDLRAEPTKAFAVGMPVDPALQSQLIAFLVRRGSTPIAPAVTRRWSWEWWCTNNNCPHTTWMERLLVMQTKVPVAKDDDAKADRPSPQELPTLGLAVRSFQAGWTEVPLSVQWLGDHIEVGPRRPASPPGMCPDLRAPLPVAALQAELLDLRNGAVLARIDESRYPSINGEAKAQVRLTTWAPATSMGYARATKTSDCSTCFLPGPETIDQTSGYTYVSSWSEVKPACEDVAVALRAILDREAPNIQVGTIAGRLLDETLGKLYR